MFDTDADGQISSAELRSKLTRYDSVDAWWVRTVEGVVKGAVWWLVAKRHGHRSHIPGVHARATRRLHIPRLGVDSY